MSVIGPLFPLGDPLPITCCRGFIFGPESLLDQRIFPMCSFSAKQSSYISEFANSRCQRQIFRRNGGCGNRSEAERRVESLLCVLASLCLKKDRRARSGSMGKGGNTREHCVEGRGVVKGSESYNTRPPWVIKMSPELYLLYTPRHAKNEL